MKTSIVKIGAVLLLTLMIGFTACEDDDNASPKGEKPNLVSVDVASDNSMATVYFSEGVYMNNDGTGAIDASTLNVTLTSDNLELSSFSVDHTAGGNSAEVSLTLSDDAATGSETLQIDVQADAIFD